MKSIPNNIPLVAGILGLASCGSVSTVGKNSLAFVQKTSADTAAKISKISEMAMDKVKPSTIPVVEVREKDLKELPTGQEKALAYENSRKRGFWFFGGPVDFQEPVLPESGGEMDGSLLPPIAP